MLETDYLIMGAGAMGLAFADELLTRSDADMILVDKRHAPGGHWNDAYPFVKLHQPSVFYGVESTAFGEERIDETGPNAGFLSLADGPSVLEYFHGVFRNRLKPSGRVRFLPLCEASPDGARVRSLVSGEETEVRVRRKVVDARYLANQVPKTHGPNFAVDADAACAAPHELPDRIADYDRYTVIGAGKTGVDVVLWLLETGARPEQLRWVVPRDPWFINRRYTQPGDAFFESVFTNFAEQREAQAKARTPQEFAHAMEACGAWIRLDPQVEPAMFHAATLSEGERDALNTIGEIVRLGRVERVRRDRLVLQRGALASTPDTLHVNCSVSALPRRPLKPVFEGDRITLLMTRFPQLPFSAALTAFLEASFEDDDYKNRFVRPVPFIDTVDDYVEALGADMMNRFQITQDDQVRRWAGRSRTDGFSRIARAVDRSDAARQAILSRVRDAMIAAAENYDALRANCRPGAIPGEAAE